jgi:hypothetical protein
VNETEFAYRVRQALNEGAEHIDYKVSLRLEKARLAALARQAPARSKAVSWVPALQLAGARAGGDMDSPSPAGAWLVRLGLAAPLLALAVGIVGIKQWQNDRMVSELAETDLAVLLDDTPIETYAHQGFGVYLRDEKNNL